MICNYTNVNDFCSNKYSYAFIDVVQSGAGIITNKSENAPVLRTDKITGQTKIINQFSNDFITTCNINDDNEETTEWECYLIYRYIASGTINDPPLQTFKDAQINLINTSYNTTIEDGILVSINNQNIILGSSISDQMSYKSVLSYAQALYDDDNDASMPSFNDKNGNIYILSYTDLIIVFKTYLEKIIFYKNLKDTLINKCNNSPSSDDIQQLNWCNTKPIEGTLKSTKYIAPGSVNTQTTVANCSDIEIGPEQPETPIECEVDNECWFCSDGDQGESWCGPEGAALCASLGGSHYEQDGICSCNYGLAAGNFTRATGSTCDCPITNSENCAVQGICCGGTCYPAGLSFCMCGDTEPPYIRFGPTNYAPAGQCLSGDGCASVFNTPATCCNGEIVPDYPVLNSCF